MILNYRQQAKQPWLQKLLCAAIIFMGTSILLHFMNASLPASLIGQFQIPGSSPTTCINFDGRGKTIFKNTMQPTLIMIVEEKE